ncbi:hypothetical protein NL676_028535 [Syzygium grande]|nr:hypothetical protein NL676_028535 [Syzygium grande]
MPCFFLLCFSPGNSSHRYVGIWYYQVSEQTVLWVANRETPISGTSGALSIDSDGNLVLHETNGSFPVWSTNVSSALSNYSTTARLMDSGNLVLVQDSSERVIWQSFDYPTDTVLPFMKVGLNRKTGLNWFLTSWKSPEDPTPGNYSCRVDTTGDECDNYGKCGPNSNCNPYYVGPLECSCLPGHEPKSPGDWYLRDGSAGCVRRGGVSVCRSGEGFVKVARVKENKIPQPKGKGCDNSGFNFDNSTARRLLLVLLGDQEEKGCVT